MPQNQGVSTARNFGVLNAKNDIIVFLDHDDFIEKSHINLVAQEIVKRGADLVATNMRFPDQHIFCAHLSSHRGFLIENGFGSGIAINRASPRVRNLLGTGELFNTENRTHFEDWELNSVAKLLAWRISIVPYASYFYRYLPSGRDSTNLSLKRRSALVTPINAINRIRKISQDNAYYSLKEYTETLVENIITLENQGNHLEILRLQDVERVLRGEIEHLRNDIQRINTNKGEYTREINQLAEQKFALEQKVFELEHRNIVALLKECVKRFELKLARVPFLAFTYRVSMRPLFSLLYRTTRAIYRTFASLSKRSNHAL
jgi:glycosyltransferase involved in cell wall biosynthesis